MTRLKDVADRAEVSTATTSRVLSGKGFVSEPLRERVLAAVAELNYVPDGLARSMTQRRTHTLGLIVSDITNPFFTAVARAVEDTAQASRYSVILCNTDESLEKERSYLAILREKRVDGIILAATSMEASHIQRLVDAGTKLVLIDRGVPGLPVPSVQVDNFGGMFEATQYLLSLGHRRIGMVTGTHSITTGSERQAGFEAAQRAAGIAPDPALLEPGGLTPDGGYAAGQRLWDLPERPTAIISWSNMTTTGLLLALHDRGARMPDDVSVIGFDDLPHFAFLDHALTVVAQPTYEIGRRACTMLLPLLDGEDTAQGEVMECRLPAQFIVRDSCRPMKEV
jgi:LacI family transcriptional regulator